MNARATTHGSSSTGRTAYADRHRHQRARRTRPVRRCRVLRRRRPPASGSGTRCRPRRRSVGRRGGSPTPPPTPAARRAPRGRRRTRRGRYRPRGGASEDPTVTTSASGARRDPIVASTPQTIPGKTLMSACRSPRPTSRGCVASDRAGSSMRPRSASASASNPPLSERERAARRRTRSGDGPASSPRIRHTTTSHDHRLQRERPVARSPTGTDAREEERRRSLAGRVLEREGRGRGCRLADRARPSSCASTGSSTSKGARTKPHVDEDGEAAHDPPRQGAQERCDPERVTGGSSRDAGPWILSCTARATASGSHGSAWSSSRLAASRPSRRRAP